MSSDILLDFISSRWAALFPESDFQCAVFGGTEDKDDLTRTLERDNLIIELSLDGPLFDEQLVSHMLHVAKTKQVKVAVEGAVPGTAPEFVAPVSALDTPIGHRVLWGTQRDYNTQLNLGRPRRRKIFAALKEKIPDVQTWPIRRLLDYLGSSDGIELVLKYGEEIELQKYEACPNCSSELFYPLHADSCHPIIGFLTRNAAYYFSCGDCGLIFLNPVAKPEHLHLYYDEYNYDGYKEMDFLSRFDCLSAESVSHFDNFRVCVDKFVPLLNEKSAVCDLGGGVGDFSVYLKQRCPEFSVRHIDFRAEASSQVLASLGIRADTANFIEDDIGQSDFDMITMWEVIEHVHAESLPKLLANIHCALKDDGLFVFSTPDFESLFGRSLDFWAMDPGEHLTVLSRRFLEPLLLKAGFEIIGEEHECVTTKKSSGWYEYASDCGATMGSRADAKIINKLIENKTLWEQSQEIMRREQLGSELIIAARKVSQ